MPTQRQTDYAIDLAEDMGEDLDDVVRKVTDFDSWEECDVETASEVIDYMLEELRERREMEREPWD